MAAAQRLSNWRRQHGRLAALDALAGIAPGGGVLTAAAIAAAEAGATLGQIAKQLMAKGGEPTVMTPLLVHPYGQRNARRPPRSGTRPAPRRRYGRRRSVHA